MFGTKSVGYLVLITYVCLTYSKTLFKILYVQNIADILAIGIFFYSLTSASAPKILHRSGPSHHRIRALLRCPPWFWWDHQLLLTVTHTGLHQLTQEVCERSVVTKTWLGCWCWTSDQTWNIYSWMSELSAAQCIWLSSALFWHDWNIYAPHKYALYQTSTHALYTLCMCLWLTSESTVTSSLIRSITSCVNVAGHRTWETKPLEHASWAVNFLPLSSSSLAWNRAEHVNRRWNQTVSLGVKRNRKAEVWPRQGPWCEGR